MNLGKQLVEGEPGKARRLMAKLWQGFQPDPYIVYTWLPTGEKFKGGVAFQPPGYLDLPLSPRPAHMSEQDWGAYLHWVEYGIQDGGATSGQVMEQDSDRYPERAEEAVLTWVLVGDLERASAEYDRERRGMTRAEYYGEARRGEAKKTLLSLPKPHAGGFVWVHVLDPNVPESKTLVPVYWVADAVLVGDSELPGVDLRRNPPPPPSGVAQEHWQWMLDIIEYAINEGPSYGEHREMAKPYDSSLTDDLVFPTFEWVFVGGQVAYTRWRQWAVDSTRSPGPAPELREGKEGRTKEVLRKLLYKGLVLRVPEFVRGAPASSAYMEVWYDPETEQGRSAYLGLLAKVNGEQEAWRIYALQFIPDTQAVFRQTWSTAWEAGAAVYRQWKGLGTNEAKEQFMSLASDQVPVLRVVAGAMFTWVVALSGKVLRRQGCSDVDRFNVAEYVQRTGAVIDGEISVPIEEISYWSLDGYYVKCQAEFETQRTSA